MNFLKNPFLFIVLALFTLMVRVAEPKAEVLQKPSQFSYAYKTELVCGTLPGFALGADIEAYAKKINRYLNYSRYFDTQFIKQLEKVREHHLNEKAAPGEKGMLVSVPTADGVEIKCTYFNRGSDKVVFMGEGHTNQRELFSPFLHMFPDYDVVLFDFRGHGFEPFDALDPSTWFTYSVSKSIFEVDTRVSKLGEVEELDVLAVVEGFKKVKHYKQVYGVSVCYASLIFLKAQAMHPGLFDKIVVDGCWDSVGKMVEKLRKDIKLLAVPQEGGWGNYWLSQQDWFQELLIFVARSGLGVNIDHDVCLTDYLPLIKDTPVMFFYGKNDLMVYRDEFEALWNSLNVDYKVAVVTENPHVRNHLKQKELYKLMCDLFFECSSAQEFMRLTQDVSVLSEHCASKLKVRCSECAEAS